MSTVALRVYDISNGRVAQWSWLLGKKFEGIWHSGVLVYGYEYFYGGGVEKMLPEQVEQCYDMTLTQVIEMGYTQRRKEDLEGYLRSVMHKFTTDTYDLANWNCNHFADQTSRFLLGHGIPSRILNLPQEVASTFFGSLLLSIVKRVYRGDNPVGGVHNVGDEVDAQQHILVEFSKIHSLEDSLARAAAKVKATTPTSRAKASVTVPQRSAAAITPSSPSALVAQIATLSPIASSSSHLQAEQFTNISAGSRSPLKEKTTRRKWSIDVALDPHVRLPPFSTDQRKTDAGAGQPHESSRVPSRIRPSRLYTSPARELLRKAEPWWAQVVEGESADNQSGSESGGDEELYSPKYTGVRSCATTSRLSDDGRPSSIDSRGVSTASSSSSSRSTRAAYSRSSSSGSSSVLSSRRGDWFVLVDNNVNNINCNNRAVATGGTMRPYRAPITEVDADEEDSLEGSEGAERRGVSRYLAWLRCNDVGQRQRTRCDRGNSRLLVAHEGGAYRCPVNDQQSFWVSAPPKYLR